mgnify:CR=1 FL=1
MAQQFSVVGVQANLNVVDRAVAFEQQSGEGRDAAPMSLFFWLWPIPIDVLTLFGSSGTIPVPNFSHAVAPRIDDAIAAVTYLVSRPDIDANRIGLLGNSESGWFTPEIAYRTNAVAFIVNRVAPSLPWIENVLWEVRNDFLADGIAESDVDALVEITEVSWKYYIAAGPHPSPRDAMRRTVINEELRRLRVNVPGANEVLRRELDDDPATFEWFANNATYDPQPYLERIELPMLYVYGETDINVPTEDCVVFLDWLRDSYGKPIDVVVFDDVGHSMFTWSGLFNAGFVPGYLELLQDWSRAQAGLE